MKALVVFAALLVLSASAVEYCTPSQSCWPSAVEISAFNKSMASTRARVMTPDDPDWVAQYLTFNQAEAKTPALIVFVGTVDHIKEALKFAFKYDIKVSIVSSGHSFFGRCGATDSMQISVHYMKDIDIDLDCAQHDTGCAMLGAGVQWGEAYREADKYNRLVVGGSNPTVSVSGWTLGGGHSPLSRSFGLGVHTTLEFHLITADLSEVWARPTETVIKRDDGETVRTNDTSLFYALRGGGSSFGVLVDITVKLFPTKPITQHVCYYPAFTDGTPKTIDVMWKSVQDFIKNAPKTFSGYLIPSVSCDPKTKACSGSSLISIIHYGAQKDSPDEAAWFKKLEDMPHSWSQQGLTLGGCQVNNYKSFYDYELSVPNVTYTVAYVGGNLIQKRYLSNQMVDVITEHYNSSYNAGRSITLTAVWLGEESTQQPDYPSPIHTGWSGAIYTLSASTNWDPAVTSDPSELKQGVRDLHADLARFSEGMYMNEAAPDLEPEVWKKEFWGMENYWKLMFIKKSWDPENRFTCPSCIGADWNPNDNSFG